MREIRTLSYGNVPYPVYQVISTTKRIAEEVAAQLVSDEVREIRIACTGTSGITLAVFLSDALSRNNVINTVQYIKKPGEENHGHGDYVLGNGLSQNIDIIVIDDLISSGDTMCNIKEFLYSKNMHIYVKYVAAQAAHHKLEILEKLFPKLQTTIS